jgi:hypothetical protein
VSSEALERALAQGRNDAQLLDGREFNSARWDAADAELAGLLAALAVAREREQCLREGLDAVLHQLNRLLPGFVTGEVARAKALARAALVDEPAAGPEPYEPHTWTRAAADEPGETPA